MRDETMSIFIDKEYKCHTSSNDGTMQEYDVPFFDSIPAYNFNKKEVE
jgi:hypothetical protein